MKTLLISALFTMNAFAGVTSIVPEKVVTPFVDIFNTSNKKLSADKMEVRVSTYNKNGELSRGKEKMEMPMADYLKAKSLSSAVYRMIPSQAWIGEDGMTYQGTAFHIGENLVLTNQHVLSPDRSNATECRGFELHDSNSSDVFACKKVHYCNVEQDVCLIEMAETKRCLNMFCSKSVLVAMKTGPAIKLKADPSMNIETMDSKVMTCIGNTMGLGIHYSQGKGIRISGDRTYFFAPLRTGNSGGPLLGEDGLAWGVVKQESGVKVGSDAYNVAVTMDKVIDLMEEQVQDKVILANFLKAVKGSDQ